MRILWLTETPSKYKRQLNSYNGRGWIESLQTMVEEISDIDQLGISFLHSTDYERLNEIKTTYYPIKRANPNNFVSWILSNWRCKIENKLEINSLENIIKDFNPDLIHVFGTESWLCYASTLTDVPCVVHIQGLLQPYLNAYLPYDVKATDLMRQNWADFLKGVSMWHFKKAFEKKAKREYIFLKKITYFMGRTDWDKSISEFLSPKSKYFHVDEILRNPFYKTVSWNNYDCKKLIITSTLSDTIYKGLDLVIKTASILNNENILFEWRIIGVQENSNTAKLFKKVLNCNYNSINIKLIGIRNAEEIIQLLKETTLYVHTSYIDNSPNSICEAQIMGVPIIATNVGGVSSLIENGKNGFLVPANDPYLLASKITHLFKNASILKELSINSIDTASKRHSKEIIINQLMSVYKHLAEQSARISHNR
ncbi:MAG: glycosyltransferase [Prolixibacteraceae bacterium]|nr:glycosyltransferase [Prolixibacteraceae bacterium]